ncbi:unnamed protein product, partial [marine sediment metagenome]
YLYFSVIIFTTLRYDNLYFLKYDANLINGI